MRFIDRFNPRADKKILIMIAGLMWITVGIMLMSFAFTWLSGFSGREQTILYAAGFLTALPVHRFGFLRIAKKNLARLLPVEGKRCLFSFMTWRSYFTVFVMMAMGIGLRHSPIPKQYLSVLYNAIGFALFLSGTRYLTGAAVLYRRKEKGSITDHRDNPA